MYCCNKCGETNIFAFYSYQRNECKSCVRARVLANRTSKVEYYRAFDRKRSKTDARKAEFAAKQVRMRKRNPLMSAAQSAVRRAIKKGVLVRNTECEFCGDSTVKIQAHHDDHAKRLDVMWLCPPCHAKRHVSLKKMGWTGSYD